MTAAVALLGLLSAGNAPVAQAAEPGSARSLREVTEHYRSDREDAVATVALWTQPEVEAGTQGLLEAVDAAKAAGLAGHATREDVAQAEATLMLGPRKSRIRLTWPASRLGAIWMMKNGEILR